MIKLCDLKNLLLFCVFGLILNSCTKQELEVKITDEVCENLQLTNFSYKWLEDPSLDSNSLTEGKVAITFNFNVEERCIDLVQFIATAYDCNSNKIDILYDAAAFKSTGDVVIVGNQVTAIFKPKFTNSALGNTLNHIIISINSSNDLGAPSEKVEIRVNATDNVVKQGTYDINNDIKNVSSSQTFFTITLWDDAAEDGDIVSVYLNGEWEIENFSLLNAETNFLIPRSKLGSGINHLVVFAQNEGSVGANTAAIAINGSEVNPFSPGLTTGEAVQIRVN